MGNHSRKSRKFWKARAQVQESIIETLGMEIDELQNVIEENRLYCSILEDEYELLEVARDLYRELAHDAMNHYNTLWNASDDVIHFVDELAADSPVGVVIASPIDDPFEVLRCLLYSIEEEEVT